MLTYQDKLRAAIHGRDLGGSVDDEDWDMMRGSSSDEQDSKDDEGDALSFTPSMADTEFDSPPSIIAIEDEPDPNHAIEDENPQKLEERANVAAVEEEDEEEERSATTKHIRTPEGHDTSTVKERTETGAILQAGSIAVGILGVGLMLAFGGAKKGGKKESGKKHKSGVQ